MTSSNSGLSKHFRGHRPAGIDCDLKQPDAGVGNKAEGWLHSDAAMARREVASTCRVFVLECLLDAGK
jgi:hypothetical protein